MKLNMFWSVEPESTHLPDEPSLSRQGQNKGKISSC